MMTGLKLLTALGLCVMASGCAHIHPCRLFEVDHPIEGAWRASDDTVFVFRHDGTFHGVDFRSREIWGTWVKLSDNRAGFHSLMYDSSYAPQYAVVDRADRNRMDYIMTDRVKFIATRRIKISEAEAFITRITTVNVALPGYLPPSSVEP